MLSAAMMTPVRDSSMWKVFRRMRGTRLSYICQKEQMEVQGDQGGPPDPLHSGRHRGGGGAHEPAARAGQQGCFCSRARLAADSLGSRMVSSMTATAASMMRETMMNRGW